MISVLSAPDAVAVAALISVLGTAIVAVVNSYGGNHPSYGIVKKVNETMRISYTMTFT